MKSTLIKFLPWVVGGVIGISIFWLPPFIKPYLGGWTYPVVIGGGLLLFFLTVVMAFAWSLPHTLRSRPLLGMEIPAEVQREIDPLLNMGFRQAGTAMHLEIGPGADLYPFIHTEHPVAVSLAHLHTMPAKVTLDMVSVLSPEGILTTTGNTEAGAAPIPENCYLQVFPNQLVEGLLEKHLKALDWLQKEKGAIVQRPSEELFRSGLELFLGKQRRMFLRNPVGCVLTAIVRAVSSGGPYIKPLWNQSA